MDVNWTHRVKSTKKVLSFDSKAKPHEEHLVSDFHLDGDSWGRTESMAWKDFIDEKNEYVLEDRANIIVELKVEQPRPM